MKLLLTLLEERLSQAIEAATGQAGLPALVRAVVENGYLNGAVLRLDGALRMGAR